MSARLDARAHLGGADFLHGNAHFLGLSLGNDDFACMFLMMFVLVVALMLVTRVAAA